MWFVLILSLTSVLSNTVAWDASFKCCASDDIRLIPLRFVVALFSHRSLNFWLDRRKFGGCLAMRLPRLFGLLGLSPFLFVGGELWFHLFLPQCLFLFFGGSFHVRYIVSRYWLLFFLFFGFEFNEPQCPIYVGFKIYVSGLDFNTFISCFWLTDSAWFDDPVSNLFVTVCSWTGWQCSGTNS